MKNDDEIVLELYDEKQVAHEYELLDIVEYDEKEYVVMLPKTFMNTEVEVFQVKHSKDKSATLYIPEKNNYIIMQVYESFKEKYEKQFPDRIQFKEN